MGDMAMDIALTDTGTLLPMPMDITVTMARDLPMLSPDMVTMDMAMDMAMDIALTVTVDMVMDITMARDLPMLSPGMVTMDMAMDIALTATVMVMVTGMVMDTTVEKFQKFMLIQSD